MKPKIKNPNGLVWLIVALLVVLFLFNNSFQQDDVIVGAYDDMAEGQDTKTSIATEKDKIKLEIVQKIKEFDNELEECRKYPLRNTDKCKALLREIEGLGNEFSTLRAIERFTNLQHEDATGVADKDKSKDNLLNHFRGNTDVRYLYFNNHWIKWAKNGWVIKDRKGNIIKTVPGAKRLDFYYTIINLDKMPKSRLSYRDFINKKGRSTVLKIQVEGVTGYVYWNKNSKKYNTLSDTPSGGLKAIEGWIITHNDKVVKSEANAAAAELKEERDQTDRPDAGAIIQNPLIPPQE